MLTSRYNELLKNCEDLKKSIEKNEKLKSDLLKKAVEIKNLRKLKNRQNGKVSKSNFSFLIEIFINKQCTELTKCYWINIL